MGERAAGTDGGPSLRLGGLRTRHGGARGGQARRQAERTAGQAAARQATEVRARAAGRSAAGVAEVMAARPCKEHGTIYAILSDFGDRMTTQHLD